MLKKRIEFPMVELILVLILLSVLAVFALPKMMDIGTEARIKTLNATALNISAINRLLYSRALINGIEHHAQQSTDILGEKDTGVNLVYGELRATEHDLSQYIESTLFTYSSTNKSGEVRLYFIHYHHKSCYISYRQAQKKTTIDGQTLLQNATTKITSTGC